MRTRSMVRKGLKKERLNHKKRGNKNTEIYKT